MSQKDLEPQRNPSRRGPAAPLEEGVKSIFIEYMPVKSLGCCNKDAYVGTLGAFGKKIRGWDHVRLVIVDGNVQKLDVNTTGQWWDLGITQGGSQCYYNNDVFRFDPKWNNKYTYFGFTNGTCNGKAIDEKAAEWVDRFRRDGFNVVYRNCLTWANGVASSILDENERVRREVQAQNDTSFQMSGVFIQTDPEIFQ